MPFLALLGRLLLGAAVASVFRVLIGLGLGFLSFTVALPTFYSYLNSFFQTLPPEILQVIGLLRIDIAITLILSALAARLVYKIASAPLISFAQN